MKNQSVVESAIEQILSEAVPEGLRNSYGKLVLTKPNLKKLSMAIAATVFAKSANTA